MSNASVAMLRRALMVAVIGVGIGSTLVATSRHAESAAEASAQPLSVTVRAPLAQAQSSFEIPSADGYGVDACLSAGGACGASVADAWCEAHGFTQAASFGPSDVPETVRVDCRA